ncbi:MAG: protein kinase [Verrucomicrobiota bacterium]|nr:protein kinase [Verrucomicrobiota bacterium]
MSEADPMVGVQFGVYEIQDTLGKGGMGCVYRARHTTLDRVVALKTLSGHLSQDADFVQRFMQEARAAARLNHPNIIQIYDFGQVDLIYYLAMEFVEGNSIGNFIKSSGRFSEADSILLMRQACASLACAHAAGVIHRDVKPDNFMLNLNGDVKLCDLGLAKLTQNEDMSLTQTGTAMGTPYYISPEQVRGDRDIDHRTDIYSLGATLYHLVTGTIPYPGATAAMIMAAHLHDTLPDPRVHVPELSEGMVRVITKMMSKDRGYRYSDMAAVDTDLYGLLEGLTPPEPLMPEEQKTVIINHGSGGTTTIPPAHQTISGGGTTYAPTGTFVEAPKSGAKIISWLSSLIVIVIVTGVGFLLLKNPENRKSLFSGVQQLMGKEGGTETTGGVGSVPKGQGGAKLIEAAKRGVATEVASLIASGADLSAKDSQEKTALIHSSFNGHLDVVKSLVEAKTDLNAVDKDGWTALMYAANAGRDDVVAFLVEKGADATLKGNDGKTALSLAQYMGHTKVMELLTKPEPPQPGPPKEEPEPLKQE